MKGIYYIIALFLLVACDSVLDQDPRDRFSESVVWDDINLADNYLKGCYNNLNMKEGWSGIMYLDAISDNIFFIHVFGTDVYLEGNITPSNQGPFQGDFFPEYNWTPLFQNIYSVNIFLQNIDKVIENSDTDIQDQIDVMKGEALFLRAFCYANLAMTYGGVPLLTKPVELGEDFSSFNRATFKETIDFITADCDKAADLLKGKSEMEMGRATKGAALALKSRLLLFAASDLTADSEVGNELVGYMKPDRTDLWAKAKKAAEDVLNLGVYSLADLGSPENEMISQAYFDFFKQKDLSNSEIIWGKMYRQDVGDFRETNLQNGPNGNSNWGSNNPTQDLVNAYRMEDGSGFFDHFMVNSNGEYINISDKYQSPNPYHNREPRFYASILYDSAKWQQRFSNLQDRDPLGIYDRRTRIITENGQTVQTIPGIDTRQGPVTPEDGGYTGYLTKKHLDDEVIGKDERNTNVWVEFRLSEIVLNYAEALMELGEIEEATKQLNRIRNRAGLPDVNSDLENALRTERRIEMAFEQKRWFDMRRWKILHQMEDVKGMTITETIDRGQNTSRTIWKEINVQNRSMKDEKLNWIPIPFDEISRAPQLNQNPGY